MCLRECANGRSSILPETKLSLRAFQQLIYTNETKKNLSFVRNIFAPIRDHLHCKKQDTEREGRYCVDPGPFNPERQHYHITGLDLTENVIRQWVFFSSAPEASASLQKPLSRWDIVLKYTSSELIQAIDIKRSAFALSNTNNEPCFPPLYLSSP